MAEADTHTVIFPPYWGDALFPALIEYRDAVYTCSECGTARPAFVCGVCNKAWCGTCEGSGTTPLSLKEVVSNTLAKTAVNDLYYEMRCCYDCKLELRNKAAQPGRPHAVFKVLHPLTKELMPFVRGMPRIQRGSIKWSTPIAVHAGSSIVCPCHLAPPASSQADASSLSVSSETASAEDGLVPGTGIE